MFLRLLMDFLEQDIYPSTACSSLADKRLAVELNGTCMARRADARQSFLPALALGLSLTLVWSSLILIWDRAQRAFLYNADMLVRIWHRAQRTRSSWTRAA
jgi:hypothetical protein